jgi:hypothetical protein
VASGWVVAVLEGMNLILASPSEYRRCRRR